MEFNFKLFIVCSIAVGLLLIGYGFLKIENQNSKLTKQGRQLTAAVAELKTDQAHIKTLAAVVAASSVKQLANRVVNVNTWCGAINEGRDEARYRASHSHVIGLAPYKLKNLNCHVLANETAKSGNKIGLAPKGQP